MAKKFVLVTGLNKVFSAISATGATTWSYSGNQADANSILYITADATDTTKFGNPYREGTHWIWAKGQLFDGNDASLTYLSSIADVEGDIAATDSVETIIRKLKKQIGDAKTSGVQSLTTSDDSWIIVDPDLNASTGAVHLNVSHGMPGTVSSSVYGNASTGTAAFGSSIGFVIPNVGVDARGHVKTLGTSTFTIKLPDTPVTAITSGGDGVVNATVNSSATGEVTLNVSHAKKAGNTGSFGSKTSNTSFKVASVTVDEYGHVTNASQLDITLGSAAVEASTAFASASHKHSVTLSGDVTSNATDISGTITTAIKDGVITKAKLSSDIFGAVASADASLVTGGQVYTAIQNQVAGAVDYLGGFATAAAITNSSKAGYGDFGRATAGFNFNNSSVHAGDMIILNSSAEGAYSTAANWVVVHGESDSWREIKVNGTLKIAPNNPLALNVVNGSFIKAEYSDGSLAINASACTLANASNGSVGLAIAKDVYDTLAEVERATTKAFSAVADSVGLDSTDDFSVDWAGKFAAGKTIVDAIKDLSTDLAAVDVPDVSYVQTVTSETAGAVKLGTIKVGTSSYEVYGKDTVYAHPAAPTTGSVNTSTNGSASATSVVTGITRDSSGHIATVTVSDISTAYNQREVKVNGATKIATTATTALDLSAGTNVSLSYADNKVVISATDTNTDEKVKDEASTATMYLLGHAAQGTTATALSNAAVYATNGALHATSLYEGTWSIHDSSAGDWGTI